jgi:SAM-dependent methyltransferase
MAAYDDFAWFYHRYWNEEFHSLAFPILERIILQRLPAGAHVLDVCCGTGHLAARLGERGYRVSGFDASPEMVRYGRETAPQADLRVAEVASFQTTERYDAAVSTFDSLNHILEKDELKAAFRNISGALKPNAWLAFDMLLEEAYQTHWGEDFALVRDDHVLTITGAGYDFRTRMACCNLTMFRSISGVWRRSDVVIRERCYTTDEIGEALECAGFGELVCHEAGDLGMAGQLGQGRTFFVTRRNTDRQTVYR